MSKVNVNEKICGVGYIPMYSVKDLEAAQWIISELNEKKIEVAMFLTEDYDALSKIVEACPETVIGAASVACAGCFKLALDAGAKFVVSPCFDEKIAEKANENDILYMPICQSFAEISSALKNGIETVSYYPSLCGGIDSLEIIARHFPKAKLVVMGESEVSVMGNIMTKTYVSALGIYRGIPETENFADADKFIADAEKAVTGYETYHIGINTPSSEDAFALATELNKLLELPIKKGPTGNFFVGKDIEVMKSFYRGTNGHIAIRTNSVDCAMYRFAKKGYKWAMDTAWYVEDGSILTVYIDEATEFGGFALHLLQKKI